MISNLRKDHFLNIWKISHTRSLPVVPNREQRLAALTDQRNKSWSHKRAENKEDETKRSAPTSVSLETREQEVKIHSESSLSKITSKSSPDAF